MHFSGSRLTFQAIVLGKVNYLKNIFFQQKKLKIVSSKITFMCSEGYFQYLSINENLTLYFCSDFELNVSTRLSRLKFIRPEEYFGKEEV